MSRGPLPPNPASIAAQLRETQAARSARADRLRNITLCISLVIIAALIGGCWWLSGEIVSSGTWLADEVEESGTADPASASTAPRSLTVNFQVADASASITGQLRTDTESGDLYVRLSAPNDGVEMSVVDGQLATRSPGVAAWQLGGDAALAASLQYGMDQLVAMIEAEPNTPAESGDPAIIVDPAVIVGRDADGNISQLTVTDAATARQVGLTILARSGEAFVAPSLTNGVVSPALG